MNKLFNKAVLNGTTVMGDGLTYPRIPNVYTGDNEGGYQRGDMMDANAVVEMIKELTDTGKITIEELQNLINEEIQERVEGDQDQQRYTDEKIKDLIGTSPETLDTLKEIADALGEDPDFAANVWNKIAELTTKHNEDVQELQDAITSGFENIDFTPYVKKTDVVTDTTNGLMLASDKQKLDSLVKYKAGNGIDITGDTISCTLDTSLYSIVTELPETGLPNKIYLLPSTKTEEGNIYTEYGYVDNKWEEIGKYKADVDLSPYERALNLPRNVIKTLGVQSGANYVNVYSLKEDLDRGILSEVSEFDIPKATSENAGIITAQDKAKLDGIEEGAQVNTIESVSVNGTPIDPVDKHINLQEVSRTSAGILPAAGTNYGTLVPYFFSYYSPSEPREFPIRWGKVSFKVPGQHSNYVCEVKLLIGDDDNTYHAAPYFSLFGMYYEGISVYREGETAIRIKAKISSDSRNILRILKDGLFVDKNLPNKQDALTEVQLNNINNAITSISINNIEQVNTNGAVDLTIPNATTAKSGLMSADDKSKLDSIIDWSDDNAGLLPIYNGDGSDGEWIYTHWIGAGQGTDNTWRKASDIILENITSDAILNNTPIATTVKAGLMSASDKTKLNSPINYYYRNAGVDTKLTNSSTDNTCYIGSPVLEILGNKVEFKGVKVCTSNGTPYIDCSTSKAVASLLDGLMSKEDKAKLDSQPTIKASNATGVTDDDYVVIKKSELDSILSRLSALENKA